MALRHRHMLVLALGVIALCVVGALMMRMSPHSPSRVTASQRPAMDDATVHAQTDHVVQELTSMNLQQGSVDIAAITPQLEELRSIVSAAEHPTGRSTLETRTTIGQLLEMAGDAHAAEVEFASVIAAATTGDYAAKATALLTQLYLDQGRLDEVSRLIHQAGANHLDRVWIDRLTAMLTAERLAPVGQPFPDFALRDLTGQLHVLSDYRGKVLLIDVWATWCPPCVAAMPEILADYSQMHSQGLEILGVSLDQEKPQLQTFITEHQISWPQIFDGQGWQGAFAKSYQVTAIPESFLIGRDGILLKRRAVGRTLTDAIRAALAAGTHTSP